MCVEFVTASSAMAACPNAGLRIGESAGLPDCRAYEQVSPAEKGGFAAYPSQATPAQVSRTGDAIAYLSYQAFPGSKGNTALFAAHVSTRTASGWKTEEWTPGVPKASVLSNYSVGYQFSEDLSQAVLQVPLVPLTPEAAPNIYNLFLRHPDGTYSLVNSTRPAMSAEEVCGTELLTCFEFVDVSAYAGASQDFSHVLFESTAQLTSEAPGPFVENLYESVGGKVKLVGILPDGLPAANSTAGAGSSAFYSDSSQSIDKRVEHSMSQDGTHVVFQAPADGGMPDPAQSELVEVYDRGGGQETVEVSAPAPGATPAVATPEPATFWAASEDGSRVFFTSAAELTTESNTGAANSGEDLYEYNIQTKHLADLSIDTNPEDSAGAMVRGVVGVSSDGSYVYFVADGVFDPGKGVAGKPNLYVVQNGGSPVFIATLNSAGTCELPENQSADSCDWTQFPAEVEADVAPDGRHLAFMSTMSLPTDNFPTGYQNVDQKTGEADTVVYEYAAPTSEEPEGHLMCASCDPSGARPIGNALLGGIANSALTPEPGVLKYRGLSSPFYRVHALSDDGHRLFYSTPSSSTLLFERVYEYEVNGEGTCRTVGGCQYLLSGGGGESDQFLGTSGTGDDVYLTSASKLVTADNDNVRDVYDARVNGGLSTRLEVVCEINCRERGGVVPLAESAASVAIGPTGNLPRPVVPKKHKKSRCRQRYRRVHGKCVKAKTRGAVTRASASNGIGRAR